MDNDFATGYALGQDANDGRNNGFGGFGDGIWPIFILAMMFGWGGGGFGGFGGNNAAVQGALTRADLCSEFNFNNLENSVRGIQQGLCDGFYAQNTSLMNGFHGVDNAVCQLGYQTQQGFSGLSRQMADCCCETQRLVERGFCDVGYGMATNTANIIQNAHNDTDRVLAKLTGMEMTRQAEKIEALRMENQTLKFQASQVSQNAYINASQDAQTAELIRRINPMPVPSYQVPAPYPYGGNCGCGGGCGCGC